MIAKSYTATSLVAFVLASTAIVSAAPTFSARALPPKPPSFPAPEFYHCASYTINLAFAEAGPEYEQAGAVLETCLNEIGIDVKGPLATSPKRQECIDTARDGMPDETFKAIMARFQKQVGKICLHFKD
ncbi:hypothetical protein BGX29_006227 [Mortierella sp. GBA35]|nr:hypothetical protein BGX29_006227 [Mortierella sp. GBA35]